MIDRFPRKEVEMMKVTKLEDVEAIQYKSEKITKDELQNEHDYLVAESLTKKLLEKGLITQTEFEKIMAKNRITFPPLLAEIMS
jgi:tetrahydromethanopterin S-methyltransferase subunit A